ncbi:hypothetical protein RJ640_002383, partial [Escallonia rubra]
EHFSASISSPLTVPLIYLVIGAVITRDNMLYSVGLSYLFASTYSLICATLHLKKFLKMNFLFSGSRNKNLYIGCSVSTTGLIAVVNGGLL